MSLSNHAFRHSDASITSSPRRLRSVTSLLALLKVLPHSVAVAGIARVSKAYWESVVRDASHFYASCSTPDYTRFGRIYTTTGIACGPWAAQDKQERSA